MRVSGTRQLLLLPPRFCFCKPSTTQLVLWNARAIRLEIKNGRAVEHIDAVDVHRTAFTTQEFDYGKPDRIRAARRARREHTVRTIIRGWCPDQREPIPCAQLIKHPEHDQMGEALDVSEPKLKLRQDLKNSFRMVLGAQTFRNLPGALVRTMYISDRLE